MSYKIVISIKGNRLISKKRTVLFKEFVDRNIQKANAVTRKSTKISLLDKSIILICDGRDLIEDGDKLKELSDKENEIKSLVDRINKEE